MPISIEGMSVAEKLRVMELPWAAPPGCRRSPAWGRARGD